MCTVYLSVQDVVRLEEAFAPRAEDVGWAVGLRVGRLTVWDRRLLLAEHAWTVANVSLEDLDFHLLHALGRLDVPLVQEDEHLDGSESHLLPHVDILLLEHEPEVLLILLLDGKVDLFLGRRLLLLFLKDVVVDLLLVTDWAAGLQE